MMADSIYVRGSQPQLLLQEEKPFPSYYDYKYASPYQKDASISSCLTEKPNANGY